LAKASFCNLSTGRQLLFMRRRHMSFAARSAFIFALALAVSCAGLHRLGTGAAVAQVWEPGDPLPGSSRTKESDLDIPQDGSILELPATTSPGFSLPGGEPLVHYPAPDDTTPPVQVDDASPDVSTSIPPAPVEKPVREKTAQVAEEDPEDFLCSRAPVGKVVPIPPPFDQWLVLVCTQDGQALVPVDGEAWVVRGSADIVSLFALPPGAQAPRRGAGFDARYDIRFEAISGGEATGERKERAISLLRLASNQNEALPDFNDIWQLDASSNVGDARYNIFFYRPGERPTRLIVCLDRCMKALHVDVLSGAEAREVLGR
jgi:hypothetical protein